jgi:16S rRNA (adenine1518-N6/adenine1519-N6)-dimethyltransferase
LESLQISPRKKWGQNFLVDSTVVQRSIVLADLHPGEVIVEIGPGLGALTESLLAAGGHVYAVEIDLRLCEALRVRWAHEGRLHLSRDDAVLRPLAQLPPMTADYKVVANLPYSIANPWVNSLLESTYLPTRMVLMVQREVGERWMAVPGTKQFSPIGIFLQSAFSVTQSIAVSKRAFIPQPRVDSVLVRLDRRTEAFRFPPPFKAFLRELFTRRRQQIGRICRENKTRPEYASLAQFLAYRGLSARDRAEDCGSRFWQEYCVLLG